MRESSQQEQGVVLRSASAIHHLADLPGRLRRGQASLGQNWWLRVAAPIDAICKRKELLHPCGPAPVLPHGPAGTTQEQDSGDLGTGFLHKPWSNGNRLTGICLSA